MKSFLGLLLVAGAAWGQTAPSTNLVTVFSHSRQFVVQGPRSPGLIDTSPHALRPMDPATTAVSAERIRQSILQTLNLPDRWQGKIRASLQPSAAATQPVDIRAVYYPQGWQYWMVLPVKIDPVKFVRAMVHVLLLEFANRQAAEKSAEIPLWMMEGLTGYLLSVNSQSLVLHPFTRLIRKDKLPDPALRLRVLLNQRTPLSFTQLALPTPETVQGEAWEVFQICAQLFVVELLRLPRGPQYFQECLRLLPQFQNWQMAFLQAYRPLFPSLLEVEKWWALALAGNEKSQRWNAWSAPDTLDKMTEILRYAAWQHSETNQPPVRSTLHLRQFVQLWDPEIQKERLRQTTDQLAVLKNKASLELVPLIDNYHRTLTDYLREQEKAEWKKQTRLRINHEPEPPLEKVLRRLEALDRRREFLASQHSVPISPSNP